MVFIVTAVLVLILAGALRRNLGLPILVAIVAHSLASIWADEIIGFADKLIGLPAALSQAIFVLIVVAAATNWAVFVSPSAGGSLVKVAASAGVLALTVLFLLHQDLITVFGADQLTNEISKLFVDHHDIVLTICGGFGLIAALDRSGD